MINANDDTIVLTPKKKRVSRILVQVIRVKSGRALTNYCYFILNKVTNEAIVIDPAWELSKITSVLKARKCKLSAILLTHHHQDHTNLANDLVRVTGADVYMSKQEIDYYGFHCDNLRPISGGVVVAANMKINVIETPGHTIGSVCYSLNDALFTGDTLFAEGCGLCQSPGSNASSLFQSLKLIASAATDNTKIYPGHRFRLPPGTRFKDVKKSNVSLQINNQTEFVRFHNRNRNLSEIEYI